MSISTAARQVPCPTCGADVGEVCTGLRRDDTHTSRIEAWRQFVRDSSAPNGTTANGRAAVRDIIDGIRRRHGW